MYIFASAAVCLGLSFLIGYPLAALFRVEHGARRLAWALVIGLAALIVTARSVQFVLPMATASWWLLGFIAIIALLAWSRPRVRSALARDIAVAGWRRLSIAAFCSLVLGLALNAAAVLGGAYLLEGTPNHDSFHYVVNAKWMLDHRFFDPVIFTREDPLFFIVANFFGHDAILGRVGGDAVLAFTSVVLGVDPLYAYNGVQTAALLIGIAASTLVPGRRFIGQMRRSMRTGLPLLVFFSVPAVMQMALNSNFANIFGATYFTALVAAFVNLRGRPRLVVATLMTMSLLASYPELVPVAFGCLGTAFIVRSALRQDSFKTLVGHGLTASGVLLLALVLAPWIAYTAFPVIENSYLVASTQGAGWPDAYAGFAGASYMAAYLTTSRQIIEMTPSVFPFVFVPFLVYLIGKAVVRGDQRLEAAVVVFFALMTANIFLNDFNYGKLKVVEYFSLFFAPLALVGSAHLYRRAGRTQARVGMSYALILLFFSVSSFPLLRDGVIWGERKQISQDLIDASRSARDALAGGGALSVETTEWGYFYSMWIPYLTRAPVVYPIPAVGGGGYLAPYLDPRPLESSKPTFAIRNSPARFDLSTPLSVSGQFRVFALDGAGASHIEGLYADEASFTWMGDALTVDLPDDAFGSYLNFATLHRFNADAPQEPVEITVGDDVICDVSFPTSGGSLSVPLDRKATDPVRIAPRRAAESPAEIGMSTDPRKLTYAVREISISKTPLYAVPSCGPITR